MPNANVQVQDEAPSFFSRFKYLIFAWVAINIVSKFHTKSATTPFIFVRGVMTNTLIFSPILCKASKQ
jgi:hypothetical protein